MNLVIKVKEIKGHCPVYELNDNFKLLDGYRLVSDIPVCMHSLAALMPYYNALRISSPEQWGLAGKENRGCAYVQCMDAQSYTNGGTAIFEITRQV
ncbi:MAG: hypothetical protein AMS27_11540 [Bacteroides sp. SM23_62_1]|nr:MAG: hypothetical protein AMS27_11540 [Bacteroides sp. SM23_62_1]